MGFGSHLWEIFVIVGPIVLAIAIGWAMLNNRQSRREDRRTEQATRDLYQEQDRADKTGDSVRDATDSPR